MECIKYSSIDQFRNVVKEVRYLSKDSVLPVLKFTGTVKIHGTNSSVIVCSNGDQFPQSKNNILTLENDNCGFARWHSENKYVFDTLREVLEIENVISTSDNIVIYGEWAGKGIQKGVAVSECEKFFYIFGVKVIDQEGEKIKHFR